MARKLVFLSLLLICLPVLVFAAEEKVIHNEWHAYHDFFTVEGDYFEVTNTHYVSGTNIATKTLLNHNQAGFILSADAPKIDDEYMVEKESCQRNGLYRYCILNVSLQPSEGARADESGYYHYGTRIKIYEEIPDEAEITITHDLEAATLYPGEKTRLIVRVRNKGAKAATNVYMNTTVDGGLIITDWNDYDTQMGNTLSLFKPSLLSNEEFSVRLWVTVDDADEGTVLSSSLAYLAPAPKKTTGKSTITVPKPHVFTYKAPVPSVKISSPATIKYTITNKDILPANISVFFNLPNDMYVIESEGFEALHRSSYDGVLEPDEEITFLKTLQSDFTGSSNYKVDVSFKIRDELYTDYQEGKIAINSGKVTPSITTGTPMALSGKPFTYGLYAHNDDATQNFFSIKGWVGTDFFNDSFDLKSLAPGGDKELSFMTYTLPHVTQATTYTIVAYGTFLTHSGEQDSFTTQKEITILPKNQTLVLLQKADKTSLKRGEVVTLTVTAENLASSGQEYISSATYFDSLLEKTFGDKTSDVYLYGGEKQELYVLKLKVPFDYYKSSFNITTELRNKGEVHSTQTQTIKVTDPVEAPIDTGDSSTNSGSTTDIVDDPEINDDQETPVVDNTSNTDDGSGSSATYPNNPSKKENFVAKFFNTIGDFFASLFT